MRHLCVPAQDCETYFNAYVAYCSGECGDALRATYAAKIISAGKPAVRFAGRFFVPLLGVVMVIVSLIIIFKKKPSSFETINLAKPSGMPALV